MKHGVAAFIVQLLECYYYYMMLLLVAVDRSLRYIEWYLMALKNLAGRNFRFELYLI